MLAPTTPRDPSFLGRLREIAPDGCAVVAYGGLIPADALAVPRHGWVNLHFSVLPAWRGAAPVQRAIMAGDDVTGATTFRLVEELDAGPTYGVMTASIRPDDTAGTLLERLATRRCRLVGQHIRRPRRGDPRGASTAGRGRVVRAEAQGRRRTRRLEHISRSSRYGTSAASLRPPEHGRPPSGGG